MRLAFPILLLLAACDSERPPAPTAEENARLDEADQALDNLAANEKGPAVRPAGPSSNSD